MALREYKIDPEVLKHAEKIGLYGETVEARLKMMAKLSRPFTHPEANRRYEQYIMFIEDDDTVSMIDLMDSAEKEYFLNRTYEERRAETEGDDPTPTGEAKVTYKDKAHRK